MLKAFAAALLALVALPATAQQGLSPEAQRGAAFVRTNCASCHSVERQGASRMPGAPPFRELHHRYPVESLAEAFAEGITTGHPSMPEFRLDPPQINDLLAYLHSLERAN